ncbi:MAG TPA: hypothetical protein VGR27_10680 [Longimicrobiaceae bacterium]|nr:hypothetical protein [Longimicrobiaceae bacterium]
MEDSRNGRTGLERWLHRFGYASEWMRQAADMVRGFAAEAAEAMPEAEPAHAGRFEDDEQPAAAADLMSVASTTAAGLLTAQLLRPREVNWPRAVLAGVIGTLLYDAGAMVDSRLAGRKIDTRRPLRAALSEDPDLEAVVEWGAHYAAGIGLASFYARYLYGRLPGSPLTQGLAFGALEAATLTWGGALHLLNRISPEIRLPPAYVGLSQEGIAPWQNVVRHLAFGAAVGLIYRASESEDGEKKVYNINIGKLLGQE